jgi:drug/metabolite transporter (DMT)-like permease
VVAILGGLGAALAWATATVCASRASRLIGAPGALAWVMVVGLALVAVPVLAFADRDDLTGHAVALLLFSGLGNVVGLLAEYAAVRRAKVGVVAPIASTEGAIAAVLATLGGESFGPGTAALLAVIAVGVVLAAAHRDPGPRGGEAGRGIVLAGGAALAFGFSLYTLGRVSSDIGLLWTLLPARLLGAVLIAAPLAARRALVLSRPAAPLVAAAGVAEVLGFLAYAAGARDEIAIAAVLASQFAALAAVGAYLALGERLSRSQLAGLLVIAVGVAVLAASRA